MMHKLWNLLAHWILPDTLQVMSLNQHMFMGQAWLVYGGYLSADLSADELARLARVS